MRVRVLFFGATAEETGEREIELDFQSGSNSSDAFAKIVADFPALRKHSLLFSINQEYAAGGEPIADGDELAIFTAVSGG